MENITIALTEPLKAFVDAQAAQRGFSTASAFIEELVREARQRATFEEVEGLLQEGLDSGEPVPVTAADWEQAREKVRAHHRQHSGKRS
jgi:antitoxin ParD1/3/4